MLDHLRTAVTATGESFGPDDHRTLAARLALGLGFRNHDRDEEAYGELAALAEDSTRILGPDHPATLTARHEAALSCLHLHMLRVDPDPARLPEAVRRLEAVAADRERLYGSAHPDTLGVWLNLAFAYGTAKRVAESEALERRIITGWRQVVADREGSSAPTRRKPGSQVSTSPIAWGARNPGRCAGRMEEAVALAARYPVPDGPP